MQEGACLDRRRAVAGQQFAHGGAHVGRLQRLAQLCHREAGMGHALRVELDQDGAPQAPKVTTSRVPWYPLEVDFQAVRDLLQLLGADGASSA